MPDVHADCLLVLISDDAIADNNQLAHLIANISNFILKLDLYFFVKRLCSTHGDYMRMCRSDCIWLVSMGWLCVSLKFLMLIEIVQREGIQHASFSLRHI